MYRLSFSTLGCPDWSWAETLDRAVEYGYEGLELRGVEGEMDLPKARPFAGGRLPGTKRELGERGLSVVCLGASCRFHERESLAENLDEARRHIDLAAELDAPFVRVFGDRVPEGASPEEAAGWVADGLSELGRYAEGTGVEVVIETHGDFSRSELLAQTLRGVESAAVGVLWDVNHPYRFFGEPLAETYSRIGERVRHVHLKDSIPEDGESRYRLLGEGEVPVAEAIRLLRESGYGAWISFEWEKRWHPEIEDPEVAFPHFVRAIREIEAAI
jgi:sugar phosphate isomerase/epimerase